MNAFSFTSIPFSGDIVKRPKSQSNHSAGKANDIIGHTEVWRGHGNNQRFCPELYQVSIS